MVGTEHKAYALTPQSMGSSSQTTQTTQSPCRLQQVHMVGGAYSLQGSLQQLSLCLRAIGHIAHPHKALHRKPQLTGLGRVQMGAGA